MKICNCIEPKKFKCNLCLYGVYCTPKLNVIYDYTTFFSVNNSEERYRIAFICRADPKKIRQSEYAKNYYICSGESDEIRPYRIIIKEYSIEKIEEWTGKIIKSIAICLARIEERYYDEKKLIILIGKKISEKKFLNNGTINKF